MRTHYCGQINAGLVDQDVTLCGWAHRRRDHGGVIFIDLRDREGLAQIVCDPDRAEMFARAEGVRNEFVLKVIGKVRRRPTGTENSNLTSVKSKFSVTIWKCSTRPSPRHSNSMKKTCRRTSA